jgi:hypothetical protein
VETALCGFFVGMKHENTSPHNVPVSAAAAKPARAQDTSPAPSRSTLGDG